MQHMDQHQTFSVEGTGQKGTDQQHKDNNAAGAGAAKPAGDKVLSASANLAQLLRTGSVMAYQALSPSFNNHGECYTSNWWLTVSLVTFLTVFCIFFAFTDSIFHNGKLYYGIALKGGLKIFNKDDEDHCINGANAETKPSWWWKSICKGKMEEELNKKKLHWLDGVHAFFTAVVFLSVAFSDVGLQKCLFPHAGRDTMELLKNMPLGMSFLSSFVFMIFPTTRHGIGFHDNADSTAAAPSNSNTPAAPSNAKVGDLKTQEEIKGPHDRNTSPSAVYHHDIEEARPQTLAADYYGNQSWYRN
uniref:Uncharacterized protein n=1 Tax=Leersia perrieri TaxID=77586 RepID=A0A0D9V163_9ORYZ